MPKPVRQSATLWLLAVFLCYVGFPQPITLAQAPRQPTLQLKGLTTSPTRGSLSKNWTTLDVTLFNPDSQPRDARIAVFYPERPDVHYARDVRIPAHCVFATWLPVGPPEARPGQKNCELRCLIYDRTGGQAVRQRSSGDEPIVSRLLSYQPDDPATVVFLDPPDEGDGWQAPPDTVADEILDFVRVFRQMTDLSERVGLIRDERLLPNAEALAGVQHIVLASRAFATDAHGQRLVRRWLEQGGRLWVMLDRADPDVVAHILGGAAGPQIVDRTSLMSATIRIEGTRTGESEQWETPMDFVRVHPGPGDTVLQTVDGWPAAFTRPVGRGRVLFTTLAAPAWYRPRTPQDPRSRFVGSPDLPVGVAPFEELARVLEPALPTKVLDVRQFTPLVQDGIGYHLMRPSTAATVFGTFLVIVIMLGVVLRRSRRPELVGWLAPVAALATGSVFLWIGERARQSVAPTVVSTAVVDVTPGGVEQPVNGLVGVFRPDAGAATVATTQGGTLALDLAGVQGQNHEQVATDLDAWHWENLAFPAGVRLGSYHYTLHSDKPLGARGSFANGVLAGELHTGPFHHLQDALLLTPSGQCFGVQITPEGRFAMQGRALVPGHLLGGSLLTDLQQRRQTIYDRLLGNDMPTHFRDQTILLAWSDEPALPFAFDDRAHINGATLLAIPVTFVSPAPEQPMTIPAAFVLCRRMLAGKAISEPTTEATVATRMRWRFQMPAAFLPFNATSARLSFHAHAPGRIVIVIANGTRLAKVNSPSEEVVVPIDRPGLFETDKRGGLYVELEMSDFLASDRPPVNKNDDLWTIDNIGLEVTGHRPQEK